MSSVHLVEFLKARLDEDEQVAQMATAGPWEWRTFHGVDELVHPVTVGGWPAHPMNVLKSSHEGWPPNGSDKDHIARHDPARVLADAAAKRGILENHGDQHDCGDPRSYEYPYVGCRDLRLLAQPYADHPDYRPEWAL